METKNLIQTLAELVEKNTPNLPPDTDKIIWRYMSVGKFMSLLAKNALFFPSLGRLRTNDPAEGRYRTDREELSFNAMMNALEGLAGRELPEPKESLEQKTRKLQEEYLGYSIFVSSWFVGDEEDITMWRHYGHEGILVKSNIRALGDSIIPNNGMKFKAGYVEYKNPSGNSSPVDCIFVKRKPYQGESEFRFIANCADIFSNNEMTHKELMYDARRFGGIYVPCDVRKLVISITIVPGENDWLKEIVTKIVEKYELGINIFESKIEL